MRVRFDVYDVDLTSGELWKRGRRLRIQEKPFQLLEALVERAGEVVSRDELYRRLWPSDTFVDFDRGLNNAANKLRTALGDSAEAPRFVETVGRRGYRFIGTLEAKEGPPQASPRVAPPARHIRSIAVLPLANLSSDPEQEYFSDGMTDLLISQIAGIQSLRVVSRQSTVRYKGSQTPMPVIARELGVDALIEGTIARSGGRVRINVQLIHGPEDSHLWRGNWERDLGDIFILQSEIARAVADAVAATVTTAEALRLQAARNVDPAAHDAYLKGRFFSRQRTREGLLRSVGCYRQAIAIEPAFAPAYAALAESYGPLGYLGFLPPHEATPAMRAAATRALELDPDLVEGLTALAACEAFHEWRWREAETHFQRAIAVDPNYSTAHLWFGLQLEIEGRHDESLAQRLRGLALDPLWLRAVVEVGRGLFMAGRHDEAAARLQSALELDPNYAFTRRALALVDLTRGHYDAAIAGFEAVGDRGSVAHALGVAGQAERARAVFDELTRQSEGEYVSPVSYALAHLGMGERDASLAALERAVTTGAVDVAATRVDPRFAPIHAEPRFAALCRRMHLPPAT